jgi:hypothetical protein
MSTLADAILAIGLGLLTMIFGAGVFELVVVVPSWSDPEGLVRYRELCRRRHPGHYYQVLAPIAIIATAAAFALSFPAGTNPVLAAGPLVGVVVAEVFTLVYFMPINRALFLRPVEEQPGDLSRGLTRKWRQANLLRLTIIAAGVACGFAALVQPA